MHFSPVSRLGPDQQVMIYAFHALLKEELKVQLGSAALAGLTWNVTLGAIEMQVRILLIKLLCVLYNYISLCFKSTL